MNTTLPQEEIVYEFSFGGLDYRFCFNPRTDDPAEGATLVYVGGYGERMDPSQHADPEAWNIANRHYGLAVGMRAGADTHGRLA